MLDCRQGTIYLGTPHQSIATHAGHHLSETNLPRPIRPQDMVPVSHALGQVQKMISSGMIAMQPTCCSVWRTVWAQTSWPSASATSKQCWQHSCVCFLKPASAPDAQHKDSTSLIDPCKACSKWNLSWETSVWPWPLYCNSVPGCYRTSYSLGHRCVEQQL